LKKSARGRILGGSPARGRRNFNAEDAEHAEKDRDGGTAMRNTECGMKRRHRTSSWLAATRRGAGNAIAEGTEKA
jgi:hypothetical protein